MILSIFEWSPIQPETSYNNPHIHFFSTMLQLLSKPTVVITQSPPSSGASERQA